MLKGLYSGRKIKATPGKLTRTQTGKQAMNAIIKKYGEIVETAKYHHIGKGEWRKYSLKNDKKRTGKTTESLDKWRSQPHKLDFKGKDTKENKKLENKKLSLSQLKSPAKPKRRSYNKRTLNTKPVLKTTKKPKCQLSQSEKAKFREENTRDITGYTLRMTLPISAYDILKINRNQNIGYAIHPRYANCDFELKFIDPIDYKEKKILIGKTKTNHKAYKAKIKKIVLESLKAAKQKYAKKEKAFIAEKKQEAYKNAQIIKNAISGIITKQINAEGHPDFPPKASVKIEPNYIKVNGEKWHDGSTFDVIVFYQDGLGESEAAKRIIIPTLEDFNNHSRSGLRTQYIIKRKMSPKLKNWIIKNHGSNSQYLKEHVFKFENF